MDRRRDDKRRHPEAKAGRDAARFARAEVVDVLAEGLLALILADRWPGNEGSGAHPAASTVASGAVRPQPQVAENAGV